MLMMLADLVLCARSSPADADDARLFGAPAKREST